jgi:histidine triad (HIT) family protein
MSDCIFCKIAAGDIPARRVLETENCVVFHDISPAAPIHLLVIPKQHLASADALREEHQALAGEMLLAAAEAARQEGATDSGYRLVMNTGRNAGQEVMHIHLHVLGGRSFKWPPG